MSKANSFRVGMVTGNIRGRVWYLCYFENGERRRPASGRSGTPPGNSPHRSTPSSKPAHRPLGGPNRSWLHRHHCPFRNDVWHISPAGTSGSVKAAICGTIDRIESVRQVRLAVQRGLRTQEFGQGYENA